MGNMCFELCKEVMRCKRKARLTKEIKDIHPLQQHDQAKRQACETNSPDSAILLNETRRVNDEVVYVCMSKLDDETRTEMDKLLHDVSLDETEGQMSTSTSSLELSCLLSELEKRRYLDQCLWVNNGHLSECINTLSEVDACLGERNLQWSSNSTKYEFANHNAVDQVTHLLSLLERDHDDISSDECINHEVITHCRLNGHRHGDIDSPGRRSVTQTHKHRLKTRETNYEVCGTELTTKNEKNRFLSERSYSPFNDSRTYPDCQPSTVIDQYLRDIDESFSKEDEITYLLGLLDRNREINTTKNENDSISTDDTITTHENTLSDSTGSITTNINESSTFCTSTWKTSTRIDNENDARDTPVVRKIDPAFVFRSEDTQSSYTRIEDTRSSYTRSEDTLSSYTRSHDTRSSCTHNEDTRPSYTRNEDTAPSYTRNKDIRSSYNRNDTVENAMGFVCKLICAEAMRVPHKVDRSLKVAPKFPRVDRVPSKHEYSCGADEVDSSISNILPEDGNECPSSTDTADTKNDTYRNLFADIDFSTSRDSREGNISSPEHGNCGAVMGDSYDVEYDDATRKDTTYTKPLKNSLERYELAQTSADQYEAPERTEIYNSPPSISDTFHVEKTYLDDERTTYDKQIQSLLTQLDLPLERRQTPTDVTSVELEPSTTSSVDTSSQVDLCGDVCPARNLSNTISSIPVDDECTYKQRTDSQYIIELKKETGTDQNVSNANVAEPAVDASSGRQSKLKRYEHTVESEDTDSGMDSETEKDFISTGERDTCQRVNDQHFYSSLNMADEISYLLSLFDDFPQCHVKRHECVDDFEREQRGCDATYVNLTHLNDSLLVDDVNDTNCSTTQGYRSDTSRPLHECKPFGDDNVAHENVIKHYNTCGNHDYQNEDNKHTTLNKTLLEECKSFELSSNRHPRETPTPSERYDVSEISVTYRLKHLRKDIVLSEDGFSDETISMKNGLHMYTRGVQGRTLSPCYEDEEESLHDDVLSLEQLIEQLSTFQVPKR